MNNTKDANLAHQLLLKYGGEVDDFFKFWPADKTYQFAADGQSFLAYGVKYKVAICMGDPVGPNKSVVKLLRQFRELCRQNGWSIVFIQTTSKYAKAYTSIGLSNVLIGSDAVINLKKFMTQTLHNKYFRNLNNRIDKHSIYLRSYSPPHDKKLINELHKISNSWSKLPNRKEWSFLTGRFDNDYLQRVDLHVLRSGSGKAEAFANELPGYKDQEFTIDLMRRRSNSPPNSIDLLFILLMEAKLKDGYTKFNLGLSPLDGKYFAKTFLDKLIVRLYGAGENLIGFKGLHQFKEKYQPDWQPRFVWYQGSPVKLVKIGLAITSLMRS